MKKDINSYHPKSNTGLIELIHPDVMVKTAGVADDILQFLQGLVPKQDKTYALVNALSAGDYYSSNLNGDWFDESELINYHKTFEVLGHIYDLHQNKDPEKSYGKVVYSYYNPTMHRVELVVEFDNIKGKDILDKLRNGDPIATSMGTRVAYEKCSICGNISKTLSSRCEHLKKEMHKIYPDGRKVYAKNYSPKFFDISVVRIPADKTSRVVRTILINEKDGKKIIIFNKKLASNNNFDYTKMASFETVAEISKELPVKVELLDNADTKEAIIKSIKGRIDNDVLYKLSEYSLSDTMSTMLALGIMPAPEDFQKIALRAFGENELAEQLEKNNILFDVNPPENKEVLIMQDLKFENANEKVASLLKEEIPRQSNYELWNLSRTLEKVARYNEDGTWQEDQPTADQRSYLSKIFFTQKDEPKKSPVKNPIVPLGILGSLYYGYSKIFKSADISKFKALLDTNPWLLPLVIGSATVGTVALQEGTFEKTASGFALRTLKSGLLAYPTSYYLSGKAENKAQLGESLGTVEEFTRKHPALIGTLLTFAGNKIQKGFSSKAKSAEKTSRLYKTANFLTHIDEKTIKTIQKDLAEVILNERKF